MDSWRLLLIGFLMIGILGQGSTKPSNGEKENYEDYAADDDYTNNYDEEESDEKNPVKPNTLPPAVLNVPSHKIRVKEGDTVKLNCVSFITNYNSTMNVISWLNETTRISQDSIKMTDDSRVSIGYNSSITITNVNYYDANDYICQIFPEHLNFTVHLEVDAKPRLRILNNGRDVMGNTIKTREGNLIELECLAVKQPSANITWASRGNRLTPEDGYKIDNGKLLIEKVDHQHAGDYQCLAESNEQNTHGAVAIIVDFAPRITVNRPFINGGIGYSRQLRCLYKSSPAPMVHWEKNDFVLKNPEKYTITLDVHNSENRTTLEIKNIDEKDAGFYQCVVRNSFGGEKRNVTLTFAPEPAHFETFDINGKHVHISWTIHSLQPLVDVLLYYQKLGERAWVRETPIINEQNKTHGIYKIDHKLELGPGVWYARVKSINSEGESEYSKPQKIDMSLGIVKDNTTDAATSLSTSISTISLVIITTIARRLLSSNNY